MKNILVPTDFSACATYATKVAFELAEFYNAKIHLYTKLDIHSDWGSFSELEKQMYPEDLQKIHNAEELFEEWIEKAAEKNILIETSWSGGKLIEVVSDYVDKYSIDFIVMGSHGRSGKRELFIGSNTQRVVRTVHCPVFIVKEDLSNYKINKVVFASSFDETEKEAFQYLLDFVKPFNPEIHLVQINTSSWFSQPYILAKKSMNDFKKMCSPMNCETHFYRDWTVDAGIRNLVEKIGANLIAISNKQRHPLKRIFAGSNVEAVVNHAEVPVLSIDFSKTKK